MLTINQHNLKTRKEVSKIMLINIRNFLSTIDQYKVHCEKSGIQLPEQQHQTIRESSEIVMPIDGRV